MEKSRAEDPPRTDLPRPGVDYLLYIGTYTRTTVFIISGVNPRQHRVSRDCHWEGTEIAMSAHDVSVIKKIPRTLLIFAITDFSPFHTIQTVHGN